MAVDTAIQDRSKSTTRGSFHQVSRVENSESFQERLLTPTRPTSHMMLYAQHCNVPIGICHEPSALIDDLNHLALIPIE